MRPPATPGRPRCLLSFAPLPATVKTAREQEASAPALQPQPARQLDHRSFAPVPQKPEHPQEMNPRQVPSPAALDPRPPYARAGARLWKLPPAFGLDLEARRNRPEPATRFDGNQ